MNNLTLFYLFNVLLTGMDEAALEDFKKAAKLGGQFAKEMVVALNPYAALCNQMLADMLKKVQSGEP